MNGVDFTRQYINLAQPQLGAEVVFATDEFFAPKERLLNPEPPVFYPDKYDDHGKWMDGWESRRKRHDGFDYCIVKLGMPGILRGFNIDTSHFTGNFPAVGAHAIAFTFGYFNALIKGISATHQLF
ncbi:unnamed protein product, partial [Cyprideis torosa]